MSWWIGALFAIGSICFALGSLPVYFNNIAAPIVAWTFFVGSLFFTSAGYLVFRETVAAPEGIFLDKESRGPLRRLIGWKPRRLDFWAALIQLIGTLFFNVTTFAGTRADLTLAQERHLIWAPDVLGSVAFLVASWFAYSEVNRGILPRSDRSTGWRISALNLLGLDRLRRVGDRLALPALDGRAGQPPARQPGHVRRGSVLPAGRDPLAGRVGAGPGS